MRRLAIIAVLLAAVAGCGGSAGGRGHLGALKLDGPGQSQLVRTRSVLAITRGRQPGKVRFRIALNAGGKRLASAATVRIPRGHGRVSVPLSGRQVQALRTCARSTLTVSGAGRRARAAVQADPPACGRFFAPNSIWNTLIPANAPLDPNDRAITYSLLQQVADGFSHGPVPTINTHSYTAPVYTVPAGQPRVPVKIDAPNYARRLKAAMRAGVPLPPGARPSNGSDGNLVVVQPSRSSMWEFMNLSHKPDGWHAKFGGVTHDLRNFPGYYKTTTEAQGASASSLAMLGGLMLTAELQRGQIDHALAIALPRTRAGWWAWPAQRSDGYVNDPAAVPEGAHFRLDPSLNIPSLHLPKALQAMAIAAQRYGIYVRDTSGSIAFVAEDPRPYYGAQNPYTKLFGRHPWQLLRRFPWSHLQLLRMDLHTWPGRGTNPPPSPPAPSGPPPVCGVPLLGC